MSTLLVSSERIKSKAGPRSRGESEGGKGEWGMVDDTRRDTNDGGNYIADRWPAREFERKGDGNKT